MHAQAVHTNDNFKTKQKIIRTKKIYQRFNFFNVQSRRGTLVSCKKYVTWNVEIEMTKKPSQNELLSRRRLQIDNNSGELMAYWEHALDLMTLQNKIKEKHYMLLIFCC